MSSFRNAIWFKSTRSNASANCVEVAVALPDNGAIGIRDSKDPHGGVLAVAPDTWGYFVTALKSGRYDGR